MDSLTHIVLGACIGDAIAGRQLGKRAMIIGAFSQSIPDLDFLTTFWLDDTGDIVNHRGITHSILFAVLSTIIVSWACRYFFRLYHISWKRWFLLIGANVLTHIFIDSFNAYGIGWLEPFSHKRFSFHVLFVADPLFSIWPFIACVALFWLRRTNARRKAWLKVGLIMPAIYLLFAIVNKAIVYSAVRRDFAARGVDTRQYLVTPTPFNSLLWFVAARDEQGYYVGYRSVFDSKRPMTFTWFAQNDSLQRQVKNKDQLRKMIGFADNFYTLDKRNDTITLYVLRFGQVVGWYDPKEKFCFYYYFDRPGSNEVVAQRGRFARWNQPTIMALLRRMGGE